MRDSSLARDQASVGGPRGPDGAAGLTSGHGESRWEGIREELGARINRLEVVLAEASAAAASMRELLEPVDSLSRFVKELETGLEEIKVAFDQSQASAPPADRAPVDIGTRRAGPVAVEEEPAEAAVPEPEPEPAAAPVEDAPTEEERPESAPPAEPARAPSQPVLLKFESSEGYLDLMTVDRILREDANIADLELAEYGGKSATIKVWFAGQGGESEKAIADSLQGIEAGFQKRGSGVTVQLVAEGEEG